ncbi:hypothetical protein ACFL35_05895 [Candidatus Riflebacteria bacterium]
MKKVYFLFIVLSGFFIFSLNAAGFPEHYDASYMQQLVGVKSLHLEVSTFPQERHINYLNSFNYPVYFSKTGSYPNRWSDIRAIERLKNRYFQMKTYNYPRSNDIQWLNRYTGEQSLCLLLNKPGPNAITNLLKSKIKYFNFEWNSHPNPQEVTRLKKLGSFNLTITRFPNAYELGKLNELPIAKLTFKKSRVPTISEIRYLNLLNHTYRLHLTNFPRSSDFRYLDQLTRMTDLIISVNHTPTSFEIRNMNNWGRPFVLSLVQERPYPSGSYELGQLNTFNSVKKILFKALNYPSHYNVNYLNQLNKQYSVWIVPKLARGKGIMTEEGIANLDLSDRKMVSNQIQKIKRSNGKIKDLFRFKMKFETLHQGKKRVPDLWQSYLDELEK